MMSYRLAKPQDMDGIMYEMHKAYFKYREQKREKERIMNL